MGREDFISDNLYHMRDRLRQNYEEKQLAKNGVPAAPVSVEMEAPAESGDAACVRQVSEAPSVAVSQDITQADRIECDPARQRDMDELEVLLLRDFALVESESDFLRHSGDVMQKFSAALKEMLDELHKTDASQRESRRVLSALRKRYFQEYGRFDAVYQRLRAGANGGVRSETGYLSNRAAWVIFAAVLGGSTMIAAVLVLLFG